MNKPGICSRCHEEFIPNGYSRYGQICPWCAKSMVLEERDMCRKLGLIPMSENDVINYLRDWDEPLGFPLI